MFFSKSAFVVLLIATIVQCTILCQNGKNSNNLKNLKCFFCIKNSGFMEVSERRNKTANLIM